MASEESKKKVAAQSESKSTQGRKFENCTEAFESGVFNIKRSDKSYENKLDRDDDGIACEK
ncbi:excalibur calcium-binding domain-containing protein [Candidatus Saccharibacteria bacterium]|nr:excalibur calcium-binding domain-containing protein [Candidatus Saccharibacteria bacterium]